MQSMGQNNLICVVLCCLVRKVSSRLQPNSVQPYSVQPNSVSRSIKAIGYDMDYTLIHYEVNAWEGLAYKVRSEGGSKRLEV